MKLVEAVSLQLSKNRRLPFANAARSGEIALKLYLGDDDDEKKKESIPTRCGDRATGTTIRTTNASKTANGTELRWQCCGLILAM